MYLYLSVFIHSINMKLDLYNRNLIHFDYEIIVLSKTWLSKYEVNHTGVRSIILIIPVE